MIPFRHDLVNILYTIQGWSESHLAQVEEGKFQTLEGRLLHAEEALARTHKQSFEALAIVRRLQGIIKEGEREKGGGERECRTSRDSKTSELRQVWRETLALLNQETYLANIEILERVPEDYPKLQIPSEGLKEILHNLAKNAIQAMQQQTASSSPKSFVGDPRLRACGDDARKNKLILRASLGFSTKEEPAAFLYIADTGPGIPQGDLRRIFEPFFTTKPPSQGNGLGLYLTRRLVEKNGGRIAVSSFHGMGTTFTLEFPLAQGAASEASTSPKAA